jgi:hypothetical protein
MAPAARWDARTDAELLYLRASGECFLKIGTWLGCSARAAMQRHKHLMLHPLPLHLLHPPETPTIVSVSGPYHASVNDATVLDRSDGHQLCQTSGGMTVGTSNCYPVGKVVNRQT